VDSDWLLSPKSCGVLQKVDWSGFRHSTIKAIDKVISRLVICRAAAARKSKEALSAFLQEQAGVGFIVRKPNSEPKTVPGLLNRLRRVTMERDTFKEEQDEAIATIAELEQELQDVREAAALRILEVEGRVEQLQEKVEWSFAEACELEEQIDVLTARVAETESVREEQKELLLPLGAAKEETKRALADLASALELVAESKMAKKGAHMKGASQNTRKRMGELRRNAKKRK
jgi:HD-GYP domain-containing protein (c-di-GMP phosphodiesterase class II)